MKKNARTPSFEANSPAANFPAGKVPETVSEEAALPAIVASSEAFRQQVVRRGAKAYVAPPAYRDWGLNE